MMAIKIVVTVEFLTEVYATMGACRIYYSDALGAPPAAPPVADSENEWEFDSFKDFVLNVSVATNQRGWACVCR
jgi:hypothetical protein